MLGPYITSLAPYYYQCSPLIVIIVAPSNPNIVFIVPLHCYCQVSQDYIMAPLGLHCGTMDSYIQKEGFFNLYHPIIVHSCNILEVATSKWLISKALISPFFYFWSQFHNIWYQSFGFQGFTAPNRSSWYFRYNFFSTKVQKLTFLE